MIFLYFILPFIASGVTASSDKIDNFEQKLAYDYDLYENVLDQELCQKHLQEMDAFEFYDASFRFPQSLLRFNTFSLGNYHQCLAIEQPLQEGSIRGKYCLIQTESLRIPILTGNSWPGNVTWVEMKNVWSDQNLEAYKTAQRELSALDVDGSRTSVVEIANTVRLTLALCIPRACSVADVLSPIVDSQFVEFDYTEDFCRLPDDKPYSGADIAAVVIFSVIGFLTLLSTAYEMNHIFIQKVSEKPDELRSCFSVYRNTTRLLTLDGRPGALACLDGVRSLSILWVVFGHSVLINYGTYITNLLDYIEWSVNLRAAFLLAANISVDSFFILSGLLLVYTSAKKMKQIQLMKNLHLFYLQRLLRMFPLLAAAVLLQASVFHQVTDGVRWNQVALETQKCRDYWWSALLHIQNLANPRAICLSHSWYLSVDVQLHILSPLLLFWALGSRRSAWTGLGAGVLGSLVAVTVYCFIKQFTVLHDVKYTVYFYHNTLTRSPPFIIGMLCGYALHCSRDKKLRMHPVVVTVGYALAILGSGYCLYQVHPDWDSQLWMTLNTALMRSVWAGSLCWLILACVNGYAGPINWFLSLKLWKFVARISYAMYIFHYPMQFTTNGANIMPIYFSMEGVFLHFASDIAYSVVVSMAACVLIDAPCSALIGRLMAVITPKKPSPTSVKEQITNETNQVQTNNETQ